MARLGRAQPFPPRITRTIYSRPLAQVRVQRPAARLPLPTRPHVAHIVYSRPLGRVFARRPTTVMRLPLLTRVRSLFIAAVTPPTFSTARPYRIMVD